MNKLQKRSLVIRAAIGCIAVAASALLCPSAHGQTYSIVESFNTTDGAYPMGGLILGGSNIYGMTSAGGIDNDGERVDPLGQRDYGWILPVWNDHVWRDQQPGSSIFCQYHCRTRTRCIYPAGYRRQRVVGFSMGVFLLTDRAILIFSILSTKDVQYEFI
jgi:hypothetical protein